MAMTADWLGPGFVLLTMGGKRPSKRRSCGPAGDVRRSRHHQSAGAAARLRHRRQPDFQPTSAFDEENPPKGTSSD